jgi:hypothetical protein
MLLAQRAGPGANHPGKKEAIGERDHCGIRIRMWIWCLRISRIDSDEMSRETVDPSTSGRDHLCFDVRPRLKARTSRFSSGAGYPRRCRPGGDEPQV